MSFIWVSRAVIGSRARELSASEGSALCHWLKGLKVVYARSVLVDLGPPREGKTGVVFVPCSPC